VLPFSNLVATEQVSFGDSVYVDLNESGSDVEFSKRSGETLIGDSEGAVGQIYCVS
jgi:hypothetical protein